MFCKCHPCAGVMLIYYISFKFYKMSLNGQKTSILLIILIMTLLEELSILNVTKNTSSPNPEAQYGVREKRKFGIQRCFSVITAMQSSKSMAHGANYYIWVLLGGGYHLLLYVLYFSTSYKNSHHYDAFYTPISLLHWNIQSIFIPLRCF